MNSPDEQLMAALRDASFVRHHGRAGRFHVIVNDLAACNQTDWFVKGAMPLNEMTEQPAEKVSAVLRCRRRACAKLWPAGVS
ncbi:hypothetical protein [uncultured Jatrophihabitans sp.]|uniref:hypothetical protein n=1 Tax=uncultured Jatrophihabitans sp. TaxID=1610747 RepID=UPI0035CADCD6